MRAIQVTCPHCGARLKVDQGDVVTCEYCGTASRVQRRTLMLERVLPPPPAIDRPAPVAVQTKRYWPLVVTLVTIPLPFVITWIVRSTVLDTTRIVGKRLEPTTQRTAKASARVPLAQRPPTWQGTDRALLADANGDGTLDVLGRGRQVHAGDVIRVIALDGKTGSQLWQTDPLGTYSDTYRGPLALSGDLIVFGSMNGEVHAFDVHTGKRAWKTALPERVSYFCAGDAHVIAVGADNMLRPLAHDTGALGTTTKAPAKRRHPRYRDIPACPPLQSDDNDDAFARAQRRETVNARLAKKLGVHPGTPVRGPGGRVFGATRATGTRVTMLVALEDDSRERWSILVSADPLGAEGQPRYVVVGERETCAVYSQRSQTRIACFSLADGARIWDEPAPAALQGLQHMGSSLLVLSHRGIEVRDIASGAVRWTTIE